MLIRIAIDPKIERYMIPLKMRGMIKIFSQAP